jgi:hypothetical protein
MTTLFRIILWKVFFSFFKLNLKLQNTLFALILTSSKPKLSLRLRSKKKPLLPIPFTALSAKGEGGCFLCSPEYLRNKASISLTLSSKAHGKVRFYGKYLNALNYEGLQNYFARNVCKKIIWLIASMTYFRER